MIRKDILPDVWPDDWQPQPSSQPQVYTVATGQTTNMVITDDGWLAPLLQAEVDSCLPAAEQIELHLSPGANLHLYRIQGIDTPARLLTSTTIVMQQNSSVQMCTVTFGGKQVRNNVVVRMRGEGCSLQADGLYLIDREQQCDNYIFVEHAAPHCTSRELYKGIVDDAARARFNGHVLVQDGAVKTEAYQTNRNILLTDKAHVDTRPFLEIYNDDVKCSHGSTIGQLDEQAMFYLQARGITRRTAVTMLSYAFCDEVVRAIALPTLRQLVADMTKKRLHGELTPTCDECSIRCSSPCNGEAAAFKIDPTRL